jgi:hypothetical protein
MLRDKFNWTNSIALDAMHAQLVRYWIDLPTLAQLQDLFANAINNTTKPLTNVWTAKMVNSQETVKTIKMVFAQLLFRTAILMDKFNWVNNNAIDAKPVLMDKFLVVITDVSPQDQYVHATNQLTLLQTSARIAQQVNLVSIKVHANQLHNHVIRMVEFNWPNNNAINAKVAPMDKFLIDQPTLALFQDHNAIATNLLMLRTLAKIAH